jgi:hypothetical protein
MPLKGISPLISIVLLVALAVAVGAIISTWLFGFTQKQTTTVGERAEESIICSYASLLLSNVKYCNGRISGQIENTGDISLLIKKLLIIYSNGSTQEIGLCLIGGEIQSCTISNLTLIPRDITLFNVSASENIAKIRVSSNCTSAYSDVSFADITSC